MTATLSTALTILVYMAMGTLIALNVKLIGGGFRNSSTATSAPDNIYTKQAAEDNRKAAEANERAQAAALKTAELNLETEKLRLERTKHDSQSKD